MSGSPGNELVEEVLRRDAAVLDSLLQLAGCLLLEARCCVEPLAHAGNASGQRAILD